MKFEKSKFEAVEELRVSWSSAILFIFFVFFFFNLWQLIHERFFVISNTLTTGQTVVSDYNGNMIFIVLSVLIVVALGISMFFRKQVWRFLTSMQLGVVLMSAITVGTILGTLVFQNSEPDKYVTYYGEFMHFIFTRLNLTNVFEAWWFLALELMLALSLICVTIRTRPWTLGRIGVAVVHLGIVACIIGAFVGTALHEEAMLFVGEGEETEYLIKSDFFTMFREHPEYLDKLNQKGNITNQFDLIKPENVDIIPEEYKIAIGGTFKLEQFEELYYEEPFMVTMLHQTTREDLFTGRQETVTMPKVRLEFDDTKPIKMPYDLGQLHIANVFRNYRAEQQLVEDENGKSLALLRVTTVSADPTVEKTSDYQRVIGEETFEQPLRGLSTTILPAAEGIARFMNPDNAFRLRYSWKHPDEAALAKAEITNKQPPFIIMSSASGESGMGGGHNEFRINIGETVSLGDSGYKVKMLRFFNHFNVKLEEDGTSTYSNSSEALVNPAIQVEVTGGNFTEPLPLTIAAMGSAPNDQNMRRFFEETNLMIGFFLAPLEDLILVGETGELLVYRQGSLEKTIDLKNETYQVPFSQISLSLEDAKEKVSTETIMHNDNPETRYAVELEVTKDGTTTKRVLELKDSSSSDEEVMNNRHRFFWSLDEKNFLAFVIRGDYIKDWRSLVTITKPDNTTITHRIRVNEPLVFNGFYYYQSDWQPKVPYGVEVADFHPTEQGAFHSHIWYTYLRVTKDPGLPLIYLGIAMLTFGMIWAFYIGPKFRKTAVNKNRSTEPAEEK